ncbi:MAG: polysaccharide biosynthesis tyrosine autokinase [Bacillus sp. (in: firmicutes)]
MEEQNSSAKSDIIDKIDIFSFLTVAFKYFRISWWLLILLMLLGAGLGVLQIEKTYVARYEASASFVVTASSTQDNIISNNYYNKISAEQLNATFPYILTSGALNQVVAQDLGLDHVPGEISAQMVGDTNLFQIKVISLDPQLAYDILQSVVENYPVVARYVIGNTKLKLLDETGVPGQPMNPKSYAGSVPKYMFSAAFLYILLLLFRTVTRHTIKNQDDLKKHLNLKYLAGIPQIHFKRRSHEEDPQILINHSSIPAIYSESIETLQIRLMKILKEKQGKSLLITSAMPGEGKTTIACNIALMMAKKGYRTLLIDCDLRNPSVARHLCMDETNGGLCDVLSGKKKAMDVITRYNDILSVLPGGKPISEVADMYNDENFGKLLESYKDQMDVIIVDTPPCSFMHDTSLIAHYVDLGLLVIRQDYAYTSKILSAVESLTQTSLVLAGCVINGESTGIGSYGYGKYGYRKYGYSRYGYSKRYGEYGQNSDTEDGLKA